MVEVGEALAAADVERERPTAPSGSPDACGVVDSAIAGISLRLQSLLVFVAQSRDGPISRTELDKGLWPDSPDARALVNTGCGGDVARSLPKRRKAYEHRTMRRHP